MFTITIFLTCVGLRPKYSLLFFAGQNPSTVKIPKIAYICGTSRHSNAYSCNTTCFTHHMQKYSFKMFWVSLTKPKRSFFRQPRFQVQRLFFLFSPNSNSFARNSLLLHALSKFFNCWWHQTVVNHELFSGCIPIVFQKFSLWQKSLKTEPVFGSLTVVVLIWILHFLMKDFQMFEVCTGFTWKLPYFKY